MMIVNKFEITLVDDWRAVCKKGTVLLSAAFAAAYGLLATVLPLISDHWLELSPFILKFFPTASEAVGPFVGALITIIVRLMKIQRREI
jgi:hypothetical protein